MKICLKYILVFLFIFSLMTNLVARDVTKVGTTAAPFLTIGVGARAMGMGGAFAAVANDASAMFWNVGGMAQTDRLSLIFNHSEWLADINFDNIDPQEVGKRLQQAFDLIDSVETRGEGWEILEEVIQSIQGRFELAGDSVFDSMLVEDDALKVISEGKEIIIEGMNRNLLDKIEFHKARSASKKEMRAIAGCGADFSADDYTQLAEKLVGMLNHMDAQLLITEPKYVPAVQEVMKSHVATRTLTDPSGWGTLILR